MKAAEFIQVIQPQVWYITTALGGLGSALFVWSLFFLGDGAHLADVLKPKHWWPTMLKLKPFLRPPGFTLMMIGWHFIVACLVWRLMFLNWDNWWRLPR